MTNNDLTAADPKPKPSDAESQLIFSPDEEKCLKAALKAFDKSVKAHEVPGTYFGAGTFSDHRGHGLDLIKSIVKDKYDRCVAASAKAQSAR